MSPVQPQRQAAYYNDFVLDQRAAFSKFTALAGARMSAVIQAPREMIEAVAGLRLPAKADHRLQELMDRNK
jgi:hypothetical protein